jgi:hypothetical protein
MSKVAAQATAEMIVTRRHFFFFFYFFSLYPYFVNKPEFGTNNNNKSLLIKEFSEQNFLIIVKQERKTNF